MTFADCTLDRSAVLDAGYDAEGHGSAPVEAGHTLHTLELFSDDGLANLLDRYPRDAFGLYTMDETLPGHRGAFVPGLPGDADGAALLEAVAQGRFWINLRKADQHLPEYARLRDALFGALEDAVPGLRTFKRDVGVLISSPGARVFYHLDVPLVTLWQIRGEKTFHVYPPAAPYAPDRAIEDVVLGLTEEEIAHCESFEAGKKSIRLVPGRMASWPQNAPHRIDNGPMLNVSLSCEYMTPAALIRANALYANGVLRRRLNRSPEIARSTPASRAAKAALARGLKLFMAGKPRTPSLVPSFVIDPAAPGFKRPLPSG